MTFETRKIWPIFVLIYIFFVGGINNFVTMSLPALLLCFVAFLAILAFFTVSAAFFVGFAVLALVGLLQAEWWFARDIFLIISVCVTAFVRPFHGARSIAAIMGAMGLLAISKNYNGAFLGLSSDTHVFAPIIFGSLAFLLYKPLQRFTHPTDYICFVGVVPMLFLYDPPFVSFWSASFVLFLAFVRSLFGHGIPTVFILFLMNVMCMSCGGLDLCGFGGVWYALSAAGCTLVSSMTLLWCSQRVPVRAPMRFVAFVLFLLGAGGLWLLKFALCTHLSTWDRCGLMGATLFLGLTQGSYLWQCYERKEPLPQVHYPSAIFALFFCALLAVTVSFWVLWLVRFQALRWAFLSLGLWYFCAIYYGWKIRRRTHLSWCCPRWRWPVWRISWPNRDFAQSFLEKMWNEPGWIVLFCVGFCALWWGGLCIR